MTRSMYDAVVPSGIPAGATLVAGYVNGRYANTVAMRARFPHAVVVGIAVTAGFNGGTVLDVEQGDASPAEAPGWVTMRRAAGVDPTVYCNTSTWPAVKAAFAAAKVAPPHYWVAHFGVAPVIPAGAIALQYRTTSEYDESVVAAYWPGVDPKPTPTPTKPKVSLAHVIAAAEADPKAAQGHTTHPADVKPVEQALKAEGYLAAAYASDGSFGSLTVEAYATWQKAYSKAHGLGWTGSAVNGIPGKTSLVALGAKHGFTVVA
ncbi:peptidoglycan-binding domain-containing protein [Streptacidiphilus sp. PAMC 29251]